MNKKKFSYLEESLTMHKNLFPNEKLFNEVIRFNEKFARKWIKLILLFSLYFSSILFISLELDESVRYIFGTSLMYLGLVFLVLSILYIYKERRLVFKKQINEIKANEEMYKYQIILHEDYRKYNKKWNIIYSIVLIITFYFSLSLFISDLIKTKNTSYGPIFILFVGLILFVIPTYLLNMSSYKKLRIKLRKIEQLIKQDNNI
ncbi:MAG TPA: hypothetical protein GX012_01630 [Acholeplasma sp.]|nr:hypothetical protein [Acholeplasma sp.]